MDTIGSVRGMRIVLHKPIERPEYCFDPLWSVYLGFSALRSYLRAAAPEHEVIVAYTREGIADARADIVGLSSVSEMWEKTKEIVRWLRSGGYGGPIIVGGPHVTALPETLPAEADSAVLGEGEETFLALVRAYQKHRHPNLSEIPGVAYRDVGRQVVRSELRAPLDMDRLPVELLESPSACLQVSTIRGCPYRCAHCVERPTQGKPRFLSAERLIWIMKRRIALTGNPEFFFQDDSFLAAPGRLEELWNLMRREDLLGKMHIRSVSLNANLVEAETIPMLKEIGVQSLGMGAESFNPHVLERIKHGVVTPEHLDRTIRLADRAGVPIGASQVYGFPGETCEEMIDSIKRVLLYERTTAFRHWVCYVCQPLPGSELWTEELAQGRVSLDMDFSTLRIDGDCRNFSSQWWYGNEEKVPRREFLDILSRFGMIAPNYFLPPQDQFPSGAHPGKRFKSFARTIYRDILLAIEGRRRRGSG